MAMLDKQLEFSDAQAVTASAASTNVIDLTATAPTIGASGVPIYVEVRINTTCTSGGSATIDVALQDSADNGSFAQVLGGDAQLAVASATAGVVIMRVPLPVNLRRYIRVYYTIGTANLTAGKFDAYLTTAPNGVS